MTTGGTAGAVVANRLTENPLFNILVIEAGPTYAFPHKCPRNLLIAPVYRNEGVLDSMVPALATSLERTTFDWNYTTLPGIGMNNRSIDYPRGRILGGSSSHSTFNLHDPINIEV